MWRGKWTEIEAKCMVSTFSSSVYSIGVWLQKKRPWSQFPEPQCSGTVAQGDSKPVQVGQPLCLLLWWLGTDTSFFSSVSARGPPQKTHFHPRKPLIQGFSAISFILPRSPHCSLISFYPAPHPFSPQPISGSTLYPNLWKPLSPRAPMTTLLLNSISFLLALYCLNSLQYCLLVLICFLKTFLPWLVWNHFLYFLFLLPRPFNFRLLSCHLLFP